MSKTLVVLRHGETDWNAQQRYQGRSDIELNATGVEQAKLGAEGWAQQQLDRIIASPLKRALKTAQIVAEPHDQQVIVEDGIMETRGGEWEGLTFTDIATRWDQTYRQWRAHDITVGPNGGETTLESGQRTASAILEHFGDSSIQTLLAVAHGSTLRAACHVLTGRENDAFDEVPRLGNCDAHVLVSETGRLGEWQLIRSNT